MDDFDGARDLREFPSELTGPLGVVVDSRLKGIHQCAPLAPTNGATPVLVSVDLSESAGPVLVAAGELADKFDSPLLVVHVVHDPVDRPGLYVKREDMAPSTPLAEVASVMLDELLSSQSERHPEIECLRDAQVLIVDGLPAGRILELVEREQPRMIVMGRRGRNGLSRALTGSVSEAVSRKSQVPVTIVKVEH